MNTVIPSRFLFRYLLPVRQIARLPKRGRQLLDLPANCVLPDFGELDAAQLRAESSVSADAPVRRRTSETESSDQTLAQHFGELRAAWNTRGLGFSVRVRGKTSPPVCDPNSPTESDGMQIWIDTRNTKNIHRASRFCHHFCLLPSGFGAQSIKPCAVQLSIAQAREDAPQVGSDVVRVSAEAHKDGYQMDTWFPLEAFNGFDPSADENAGENPLLGFYYCLRDRELGEQFLSVGWEFPIAHDPSLWATLELIR